MPTPESPHAGDFFGDLDWLDDAACRDNGPEFFSENPRAQRTAIVACQECTVTAKCLAVAMENGETSGVWGGLTPQQRRQLAKTAPAGKTWVEALRAARRNTRAQGL